MHLTLDHTQRLNLIAILDALECQGRREMFAVCRLQEKLELNDEERAAIGWRKEKVPDGSGREGVLWSARAEPIICDCEISEDDVQRICRALDKFPVVLGRDKAWYLPLVMQLPMPDKAEVNSTQMAAARGD
jgi:hypothetical protein